MIAKLLEHYGADLSRVRETGWRPLKCPFHDDRTASASVNLDKGAFKCHACEAKGDAIAIIMQQEGLGFTDAVRWAQEVLGESSELLPRAATREKAVVRSKWRTRLFDGS